MVCRLGTGSGFNFSPTDFWLLWLFHQTTTNSNHTNTELTDETNRSSFSSIVCYTIYNPFSPTCHHDPQPADGFHWIKAENQQTFKSDIAPQYHLCTLFRSPVPMADPIETTAETTVETTDGPPPLPYSLRQRKRSIAFFWTLFVIDTLAQPLILYFALRYRTSLSLNLVFSISTAALGGVSVFEYFYRLYNLMKSKSRARPLNARKSWVSLFRSVNHFH